MVKLFLMGTNDNSTILMNRYQLIRKLGQGGMAVVYQARDLMLERTVAVKILREDFSKNTLFRERFHQEAKAAANLTHPNIVTVHDFGWDQGHLFMVLEHVPGTNLKDLIQQRGSFPIKESVNLIIQACAGVGYAHRAGLVHCDIKPQNMIVTPDKRLKVTDFGIARALASIKPGEKSNVVWGSPQYISPEQASGLAPSPASDVYSLGVVLYELLTGTLPYNAKTATEFIRMHREVIPPPPRTLNPNIPEEVEQIVMKVLAKEPAARYRTADQMGRVLITFTKDEAARQLQASNGQVINKAYRQVPTARAIKFPPERQTTLESTNQAPTQIDWLTILLGLLALISAGGLIPFWLWVYITLNPPIK